MANDREGGVVDGESGAVNVPQESSSQDLSQIIGAIPEAVFKQGQEKFLQGLLRTHGDEKTLTDQELSQARDALASIRASLRRIDRDGFESEYSDEAGYTADERQAIAASLEGLRRLVAEADPKLSNEDLARSNRRNAEAKLARGKELLATYPEYEGLSPVDLITQKSRAEARKQEILRAEQELDLSHNDELDRAEVLYKERYDLDDRVLALNFLIDRDIPHRE